MMLNFQGDFIRSLEAVPLTPDDPSGWERWTPLRRRRAIAAAFDRLGRDLPEELREKAPAVCSERTSKSSSGSMLIAGKPETHAGPVLI
jgi:hypothetical protein